MLNNFNEVVIPYYSPVTSRGGKRRSRKHKTRKHKKNNKSRTRRRYH
jgi:hypothetical protein